MEKSTDQNIVSRSKLKEETFKLFHILLKFRKRSLTFYILEACICFCQLLRFTYGIKVTLILYYIYR